MKQKIALILAALAVFCSCGPSHKLEETDNVYSKMDDIMFIKYCQDFLDPNRDDVLSMEEAAAVDAINIPAQYTVSSLKGIEYFTNLSTLSCARNPVKSIDLSGNAALTELDCSETQISSLDLSGNKALTVLKCDDLQISSLDLSKNRKLEHLSCSGTRLSSLDLSQNKALKYLNCNNSALSSLDLSGNKALAELYCRDNDLSSLDMSKNKALKEMECQRNRLSSLDLSGNVELVSLDCSDNRLSELDISKTLLFMTEYKNLVEEILEWQKMDCLYQKVPMTLYMNQSQYDRIYEEHGDTLKMLNINAVVR